MSRERYKVPFVVANTSQGTLILNVLDWAPLTETHIQLGVGLDLLVNGEFDRPLIELALGAIEARHRAFGPGVVVLDCGANIGVHSLEYGRFMTGWGNVLAFEPQHRMYYALCGNLAINNVYNVRAYEQAIGSSCGPIPIHEVDYGFPSQFGGFSLKNNTGEFLVEQVTIDSMKLPRLDFIKLDIEGMEVDALNGARESIEKYQPFILAEWHLAGKEGIMEFMKSVGYTTAFMGMNMFAGPPGDVMDKYKEVSVMTEAEHERSSRKNI